MNIEPIATIETPFTEKFAIPRQAQIVTSAWGTLNFCGEYNHSDSMNGLTAHSHYWLIWGFHVNENKEKTLTVRPPRLGGNKRVGVFGTRSPFRPNNLGLSVVKLESINEENYTLTFSGVDMLSGSPVYDLKPYVPYADSRDDATSEWADFSPDAEFSVSFYPHVEALLNEYDAKTGLRLTSLVTELLAYDPRPAYKNGKIDDKIYATTLYDMDISWKIDINKNIVHIISAQRVEL